jgi:hypothetical protein
VQKELLACSSDGMKFSWHSSFLNVVVLLADMWSAIQMRP